jgi:hypothetical protein
MPDAPRDRRPSRRCPPGGPGRPGRAGDLPGPPRRRRRGKPPPLPGRPPAPGGTPARAEEDFVQQARQQGLETVAQWVASLPVQNLPTFRQALEGLRTHWDEGELTERLAQEFARLPGVPTNSRPAPWPSTWPACAPACWPTRTCAPWSSPSAPCARRRGWSASWRRWTPSTGPSTASWACPRTWSPGRSRPFRKSPNCAPTSCSPPTAWSPTPDGPSRKRGRTCWPGRGDWRRPGRRWDCARTSARAARARPAC